jgi:L-threonylcarbamoyladenylate synthase
METIIGKDIEIAKQHLLNGELVAIPTETVYGLASNAMDEQAVIKIFEVKNRPTFNPLIIHCSSWATAQLYVKNVPVKAIYLAEKFTPGPLTFLLDKQENISDLVTAGSKQVAVRIPKHPLTLALLQSLDYPLAAPSANPFGYISPTTAAHVLQNLAGKIPYILDGGPADVGLESTIIGFDENKRVLLYRSGGVSLEAIEEVLQEKVIIVENQHVENPATPGQLKSHYAPVTPLYNGNIKEMLNKWKDKRVASISFSTHFDEIPSENQFVLSTGQSLSEAAGKLFAALRSIDQLEVDVILAEVFPEQGLGRAINDRLKRAGAKHE